MRLISTFQDPMQSPEQIQRWRRFWNMEESDRLRRRLLDSITREYD